MNLSRTQWIIVAVLGAVAVWYFATLKKRKNIELTAPKESGYGSPRIFGGKNMYGSPRFGSEYGSPR